MMRHSGAWMVEGVAYEFILCADEIKKFFLLRKID